MHSFTFFGTSRSTFLHSTDIETLLLGFGQELDVRYTAERPASPRSADPPRRICLPQDRSNNITNQHNHEEKIPEKKLRRPLGTACSN